MPPVAKEICWSRLLTPMVSMMIFLSLNFMTMSHEIISSPKTQTLNFQGNELELSGCLDLMRFS
jgi:hypothetical protein